MRMGAGAGVGERVGWGLGGMGGADAFSCNAVVVILLL